MNKPSVMGSGSFTGAKSDRQASAKPDRALATASPYIFVFATAFLVRILFNFQIGHMNAYSACDAWEYLSNAATLNDFASHYLPDNFFASGLALLSNIATPAQIHIVRSVFAPFSDFAISGPVFPLYLLGTYKLLGLPLDPANWAAPIFVQSFFSALTCVFIAAIGKLIWEERTALVAGLLAAFYPAFIINSGRLYPETFACFLLTFGFWLSASGFSRQGNTNWQYLMLGLSAASLELTRSIMVILSLLFFPVTYIQRQKNKPLAALIALALGFAAVLAPWLCFQKLAFGKASIVVDRVGHYNFFIGNDIPGRGYLTVPYQDGHGIEAKSFVSLAKESFDKSPSRWLGLMLNKWPHLFKLPWNDFRTVIGPIKTDIQALFHQALLLLALLGIILSIDSFKNIANKTVLRHKQYLFSLAVAVLALHCSYLLFITVPRYNLTAMPFVIVFAAAALVYMTKLGGERSLAKALFLPLSAALCLLTLAADLISPLAQLPPLGTHFFLCPLIAALIKASSCLLFLFAAIKATSTKAARLSALALTLCLIAPTCLPLSAHGRWWQWHKELNKPGQTITSTIPLSDTARRPNSQAFLLVDSGQVQALMTGAKLAVNGKDVDGPFIPAISLLSNFDSYRTRNKNRIFLEIEDIFDALCVPCGINACDLRQWFLLPLPDECLAAGNGLKVMLTKTNTVPLTFFGAYKLSDKNISLPSTTLYSWEKAFYGVEEYGKLSDTRYDMKLEASRQPQAFYKNELLAGQPFIRLLLEPQALGKIQTLYKSPLGDKSVRNNSSGLDLIAAAALPAYGASDFWFVRLSGLVEKRQRGVDPGIEVIFHVRANNGRLLSYPSPWSLKRLSSSCTRQAFDFALPLKPASLPGRLQSIELRYEAESPRLALEVPQSAICGSARFTNLRLEILDLPATPQVERGRIF